MNNFCKAMYDGLYSFADSQFKGMFESLNGMISDSTAFITQSPQAWSSTAYSFIKGVAENVCIPIAGCIITFVFCLELIHMIQDNNQMHAITPEKMVLLLLKLGIFLLIASKSFDIVMGVYDIGSWAAKHVNPDAAGSVGNIDLSQILKPPKDDKYDLGMVFSMLINTLLICLARVVVFALAVAIFVQTNMWYLELLIYTSVAPLPMSTFMNREWGQDRKQLCAQDHRGMLPGVLHACGVRPVQRACHKHAVCRRGRIHVQTVHDARLRMRAVPYTV